jgi:hypothetical protein
MTKYTIKYQNKVSRQERVWEHYSSLETAQRDFDIMVASSKEHYDILLIKTTEEVIKKATGEFVAR